MGANLKRHLRHLPALLGVLLLFGAVYVVQREFRHLKIADISKALDAIPRRALFISAGWTFLSYGILTFYDRLGTIYAGKIVSYGKVAFASFCAYALSHNLGFAAVSGAAVRYRLYAHWGLTPLQIGKVVAFCSLTFGLGGMVLGGIILFIEPGSVPFFGTAFSKWAMYGIGLGLWAIVGAYVTVSKVYGTINFRGHPVELPSWRMAILQVLLATLDVAVTAAIFHALLPAAPGLNYLKFLGVYVASYTAGLAANLPGGIGVFDTAMLLGLSPYLEPPQIIGAILVFRLYYYIIPLFLAGSLFAGNEVMLRGRSLIGNDAKPGTGASAIVAQPATTRWSEPDFAIAAATGAVALCGALLLSMGVLEQRPDFSWIDPDYAEVAAKAGQFVPSLIGAALMVLAIAMSQRVTLAWGATILLLLVAAAFTAIQGDSLWIPGMLMIATGLVAPFRSAFYRHASLLAGPMQAATAVPLFALAGCIMALALFERHVRWLTDNSWWEVILSPDIPNSLRATVALTVGLGLVAIWRLVRPGHVVWLPWDARTRLQYAALGAIPPVQADGMLWGETERAAIPFRRLGPVLLGLGDPAGSQADRISAVWRLRDLALQEGRDAAVWRAEGSLLKVYSDLGLTALPLDTEGMPCQSVAVRGHGLHPQQYLVCVAERDLPTLLPLLGELDHPVREAAE